MEEKKKSKNQLLKELQDTVDRFNEKKAMVDSLLIEIDELEKKYLMTVKEIQNK